MYARRTALLRLVAMAALVVSAALFSDHLNPDRAFCPLEKACELARESDLGTILGIPTSILGMLAFGGLFFLTLLPVEWGRRPLQAGGLVASLAGGGFILYQAVELQSFCPLCLVADGAGLLAGLITLTWPRPPIRVSGRRLAGERVLTRTAWTVAGVLAVVLPFVWPRPERPSWVEIPAQARAMMGELDDEAVLAVLPAVPDPVHPRAAARRGPPEPRALPADPDLAGPPAPPAVELAAAPELPPRSSSPRTSLPAASTSIRPGADDEEPAPEPTAPEPEAMPAPEPVVEPPAPVVPDAPRGPLIVEYLNAYCPHCRATHRRLEKVLHELGVAVRYRRIYAWASKDYPFWARACVCARQQGEELEDRFFRELMRAPNQSPAAVFAAARRAGVDVAALQQALGRSNVPPSLVQDSLRMRSAGLRGLPTLDVGRRRLMGEQTEAELREAIQVAVRAAGGT